jgi:Rad3-related DNA helicase
MLKHVDQRGIIHTASYHLSTKIWNGLTAANKDRILMYNGTAEKRAALLELKENHNRILMGPSLTEGLDLKDNLSRFQIFAKVPYLSLGDTFVKAKMNQNPGWYRQKAIIALLQGIGRSVRGADDWAITYILDGSLTDLIHRTPAGFSPEFRNRVKLIKE